MEPVLVAGLVALNALGFVLAIYDKARARRQGRRIPELGFHLLGFLCAWPGCVIGFLVARHKVRKLRFQAPFVLASAVGTALLLFFLL